jgi:sodium/proline symporter
MPSLIWTNVVFFIYFVAMIVIGAFFFKKSDSLSDYFIGGRRLNSWVAALSAYASDMSGWLMMGFVGTVYAFGAGQIWIAVGLALGTILNWLLVARRLRRYSLTAKYSITIPEYFENRFQDSSHLLRFMSAIFIGIFFTIYTASGFVACGTLFSQVFHIDYRVALLISALVILIYTFLGGFRAVCWTDFIQGLLMIFTIMAVPIIILLFMEDRPAVFRGLPPEFFNVFLSRDHEPLSPVSIISQLGWGLGYFGMPHILIRFMAVKDEKAVSGSVVIAGIGVILSLGGAVAMGIIGAALIPGLEDSETVFIQAIQKFFMAPEMFLPFHFLGALFFCGIFAAIMSTADSQLLVTVSALINDIYHGLIRKDASDKYFLRFSRFSVVVISVIAYIVAIARPASVMEMVSNAWSGFGSTFGALVLCSLYWRRLNRAGAIAGILTGGLTVILWDYVVCIPAGNDWVTVAQATGLYSLVPGFCISLLCIVAVSLSTAPPTREIYDEFERAATKPIFEE